MRILVTGAGGQIGSELISAVNRRHGEDQVLCTDLDPSRIKDAVHREALDVTDAAALRDIIRRYEINEIYHLAAILSGTGEKNPQLAYRVNMDGTFNILEAARESGIAKVFAPSSIAVFGRGINRANTGDEAPLRPATMYGVTKVSAELLFDYYRDRYDLDVRSLRFRGLFPGKPNPAAAVPITPSIFTAARFNGLRTRVSSGKIRYSRLCTCRTLSVPSKS
jgi:nucleoside-diphosphate-sugar epimerase